MLFGTCGDLSSKEHQGVLYCRIVDKMVFPCGLRCILLKEYGCTHHQEWQD